MHKIRKIVGNLWVNIHLKFKVYRKKTAAYISRKPLTSFLITLGVLFALIVIGNFLRKPPAAPPEKKPGAKQAEVYRVGDSPRVTVQASVEKTGVITIVAQTPGIVNNVYLKAGDRVNAGQSVVWLSSSYQGGNPASVNRMIAARNAQFSTETYDISKDLVNKQRDIANKGNTQAEELREIGRKSLDETKNLINASTDVVSSVDRQIAALQQNNVNGANDAAIQQLIQGKLAAQGSLVQLNAQLRTAEYNTDENKTPAQLGDAQKDLTNRQLDLQDKSVDLQRDVANLNLKLARVSEALYAPASPVAGTVERVYVTVGDAVNPGDKIATIHADQNSVIATALVDQNVAARYTISEDSIIKFADGTTANLTADYVPSEATDGTLSAISFTIPELYANKVSNSGFVTVAMPLGAGASSGEPIYVPLDSIYQTQDSSYIFVARRDKSGKYVARTQEVVLAEVSGAFVRVSEGVAAGDVVIVSRFVQEGDLVKF